MEDEVMLCMIVGLTFSTLGLVFATVGVIWNYSLS